LLDTRLALADIACEVLRDTGVQRVAEPLEKIVAFQTAADALTP
jgi:hypothetical protein